MARIVNRELNDAKKREIVKNAGGQCQCNFKHIGGRCTIGVNKSSDFFTNLPKGAVLFDDAIKVLCKKCVASGHHHHLAFPPTPALTVEDLVKRFKTKGSSGK